MRSVNYGTKNDKIKFCDSYFTVYWLWIISFFSAIDIATILYPPQFTNPSWELQTIGGIVERVPVPLIGFGFVFLGEPSQWKIPERVLLNLTSFLSLVVAALFLFLVPLGIVNTIRINNENTETITT